jgi:hypothetical protein
VECRETAGGGNSAERSRFSGAEAAEGAALPGADIACARIVSALAGSPTGSSDSNAMTPGARMRFVFMPNADPKIWRCLPPGEQAFCRPSPFSG